MDSESLINAYKIYMDIAIQIARWAKRLQWD